MAEGLLKDMAQGREDEFLIGSAGVSAMDGFGASRDTIDVMKDNGLDVTQHRSRRLTAAMVRSADVIYVMEKGHRDFILRAWPESREKIKFLDDEEVADPMVMGGYENTFQVIQDRVRAIARSLGL